MLRTPWGVCYTRGMADYASFLTLPVAVNAFRCMIETYVQVGLKNVLVPRGVWVVVAKKGTGQVFLVPDDVFREGYRPTDTKSEAFWNERTNKVWPVWPTKDASPIKLD